MNGIKLYKMFLKRYPLSSQAIQTGLLMGAGDVIAQTAIEKIQLKDFDLKRTGQFFAIGTFCVGPPLHKWYNFLHEKFKSAAMKKVACDQLLFAPIFLGVILSIISVTQGNSLEETRKRLERDYVDIVLNGFKVWPAVQMFNFYLVPVQYQVLLVQVVAIFWNTYVSWKTNQSEAFE